MIKLPKELEREPLVDAVFEVRFGGDPHMADLLPGFLFGQLSPRPTIQRLPAADIPQPIRNSDPNLSFAPVTRLDWQEFTISFGDRNLVIACKLPYPKWPRFKEAILDIVGKVTAVGINGPVVRFSVKYVNLISGSTISNQIAKINLAVRVGDVEAREDHLSVQVHHREHDALHIMSVITGAEVQLADGRTIAGAIVDIDSIREVYFSSFNEFAVQLEPDLEALRLANKVKFFSCLNDETVQEMRPRYD